MGAMIESSARPVGAKKKGRKWTGLWRCCRQLPCCNRSPMEQRWWSAAEGMLTGAKECHESQFRGRGGGSFLAA